jgi:hypothetical protein
MMGEWRRTDATMNAIAYAKFHSRSYDAVIRIYDEAANVIETHEHKGEFKEWRADVERFFPGFRFSDAELFGTILLFGFIAWPLKTSMPDQRQKL